MSNDGPLELIVAAFADETGAHGETRPTKAAYESSTSWRTCVGSGSNKEKAMTADTKPMTANTKSGLESIDHSGNFVR